MQFVATINIPGYLPMDDEPPTFDTAAEAWDYLASERMRAEDEFGGIPDDENDPDGPCHYSETVIRLEEASMSLKGDGTPYNWIGTVYGNTPGSDSEHDLGLAYSVDYAEGDE